MVRRSEAPSKYGVNLADDSQREKWAELSKRNVFPTRVPCPDTLDRLGLGDDFWKLCTLGHDIPGENEEEPRGIYRLLCSVEVYRGPTLEFLSTLKVHKRGRPTTVTQITFQLGGISRTLLPDDLREVFLLPHDEEEEVDLDDNVFWNMITTKEQFTSGESKSSAIRNPILRILHRAISNAVFPRSDSGSVNNTELHLMYSLLNRKCNRLSTHLAKYWERIATRPSASDILCGNHVTWIMRHLGIQEVPRNVVPGEEFLKFDALSNMDIVKVDTNKRAYVFQGKKGDHFPLPCPRLTHVDTWEGDISNWTMNSDLHHRVIAAHPYTGYWLRDTEPLTSLIPIPAGEASTSQTVEQHMEEEASRPEMHGSYYYNRRTRDRV